MVDKSVKIMASVKETPGERTILETTLEPEATVFWHYHTLFDETFEVQEGEINVWCGEQRTTLKKGDSATVKKDTIHRYAVGTKTTVVRLTFEPGNLNFEKAMCILSGVQDEDTYRKFSDTGDDNLVFIPNSIY